MTDRTGNPHTRGREWMATMATPPGSVAPSLVHHVSVPSMMPAHRSPEVAGMLNQP